jgi:hypothetical protein
MDHDGARWIEELPAGLAAQQGLLRGLRAFSQDDPDVAWLVVGCSLARDAGDWLSDIDAAVGVSEAQFTSVSPRVRSAVDGLGELVESYHHKLPGVAVMHERIFAQYADRSQLDLVVYPSTVFAGSIPHVVVLYDQDSVLAAPDTVPPVPVTPSQVREWAFQGWCALAAGLRVAELLGEVGEQLDGEQRAALPAAMGRFITGDLLAAMAG